jgi:predicted unusual protein kinase regulating ubiquinone biosynthesis (AarF/ABC1/UbiB family)
MDGSQAASADPVVPPQDAAALTGRPAGSSMDHESTRIMPMSDDNKSDGSRKKFSATTPAKRFFKLAGMTAGIATNIARNQMKNLVGAATSPEDRSRMYTEIGEQLANTLGEMKGAVMKVGQIASQFKDVFPREIAEALAKLQKESPPMPFGVIERQIIAELGKPPAELFAHIDTRPFAAASIGQVHRARTHAGEDVVIKVQYPGVEDCVESDLKHLRMALKMAGLLKIDKDMLDGIFAEIRRSLIEELDYKEEAEHGRLFAEFHKNDPKIIIPRVYEEYTARRVLTMAYEPGDDISQIKAPAYSQETINELGMRVFNAIGAQIYGLNAVHCDPHPGNFAFRSDGSVVIYDFGCIKKIRPEIVEAFRKTTLAALAEDYTALDLALIEMGVRNTDNTPCIGSDFYAPWAELTMRCFSDKPYDFAHSSLHEEFVNRARKSLKYIEAFRASPETMLVNRAIGGHYWTMKQLGVITAFRPALQEALSLPPRAA